MSFISVHNEHGHAQSEGCLDNFKVSIAHRAPSIDDVEKSCVMLTSAQRPHEVEALEFVTLMLANFLT